MTVMDERGAIRSRVDGAVGWVTLDGVDHGDSQIVQRQALDALAAHVRNPAVQTIAISDLPRTVFNAIPENLAGPQDAVRIEKLAALCLELAELLSASSKTLVVRCANREAMGAPAHSLAYLEPLTRRERQVLALACEGLSAREIGSELFISERTVETHISNGYRKLGINSRIDLVRRAAEFGL